MIGIILASHGSMAKGVFESYQFFNNDCENMEYLCLEADADPTAFKDLLESKYEYVNDGDGVIILADIPGGTPANQALLLAQEHEDIRIVSGLNLIMLLDLSLKRNHIPLDEVTNQVFESAKESIVVLSAKSDNSSDENISF